jgi:MFS transporter, ACS family, tartrate transporter
MATSDIAAPLTAEGSTSERETTRKVHRHLIPFLFVLYIAAYLDRINIGFAQLQMKEALQFSDIVYGTGSGIFFLGYFLFEIPSNLILTRIGARVWIARIMITWGIISAAMAFVRTPTSFYVLRFLLGLAEAGFFPGVIYYMSRWFPAAERGAAVARFMTATAVSGIIGGPLSGYLLSLDGVAGLAGWQWIFLAEGVPSVLLGFAVWKFLPNGPDEAKWLTPSERDLLEARVAADAEAIQKRHRIDLRTALTHNTVWLLSLLYFTLVIGLYGVSFWLPQIMKSLSGLSNIQVAVLSAIPYLAATIAMVIFGRHSDKTGERKYHVAIAALVGSLGIAASTQMHSALPGLITLSIAAMGIWCALPVFWALATSFLTGTAAAGAIALMNSFGNLGGFVGPYAMGRVRSITEGFTASLMIVAVALFLGSLIAARIKRT